LRCHEPITEPY